MTKTPKAVEEILKDGKQHTVEIHSTSDGTRWFVDDVEISDDLETANRALRNVWNPRNPQGLG